MTILPAFCSQKRGEKVYHRRLKFIMPRGGGGDYNFTKPALTA